MENLGMRAWLSASILLGLAVVVAFGTACAGLKAPTLAVDSVNVRDMGLTGVSLDVTFRVRNPNPEPITVDRFEYELSLNGNRLGRGYEPTGFELEGFGEEKITSRFDVNLLSLPVAAKRLLERHDGRARVKGHFYVTEEGATKLRKLGFHADADLTFGR
jgi:LEA14-like dessication related protein